MSWIGPSEAVLYLAAGAVIGTVHVLLLVLTVRLPASRATALSIFPLYGLRLAAAGAGFWAIVQQGALPLLVALMGFVIARTAGQLRMGAA